MINIVNFSLSIFIWLKNLDAKNGVILLKYILLDFITSPSINVTITGKIAFAAIETPIEAPELFIKKAININIEERDKSCNIQIKIFLKIIEKSEEFKTTFVIDIRVINPKTTFIKTKNIESKYIHIAFENTIFSLEMDFDITFLIVPSLKSDPTKIQMIIEKIKGDIDENIILKYPIVLTSIAPIFLDATIETLSAKIVKQIEINIQINKYFDFLSLNIS